MLSFLAGEVEGFEQRALQQGDTAEVVDLQAQQLEGGAQARTAQEGVMSWLHPDDPLQSPLASPSQPQAVAGDFDRLPSMESAVSATSQMGSVSALLAREATGKACCAMLRCAVPCCAVLCHAMPYSTCCKAKSA